MSPSRSAARSSSMKKSAPSSACSRRDRHRCRFSIRRLSAPSSCGPMPPRLGEAGCSVCPPVARRVGEDGGAGDGRREDADAAGRDAVVPRRLATASVNDAGGGADVLLRSQPMDPHRRSRFSLRDRLPQCDEPNARAMLGRRREFSIRLALGASRIQVVRLLLLEALMLAAAAARWEYWWPTGSAATPHPRTIAKQF